MGSRGRAAPRKLTDAGEGARATDRRHLPSHSRLPCTPIFMKQLYFLASNCSRSRSFFSRTSGVNVGPRSSAS